MNNDNVDNDPTPLVMLHSTESMEIDVVPASPIPAPFFTPLDSTPTPTPITANTLQDAPAPSSSLPPHLRHTQDAILHHRPPTIQIYSFGRGDCGQLGVPLLLNKNNNKNNNNTESQEQEEEECSSTPQRVDTLSNKNISYLTAGAFHSIAITGDGEVYTWGANEDGQCAVKNTNGNDTTGTPTQISALDNFRIHYASCGSEHSLAVAQNECFGFGSNEFGQLGISTPSTASTATATATAQPKVCKGLKGFHVSRVAAGGHHSLFLEQPTGVVFAAGDTASFGATGLQDANRVGAGVEAETYTYTSIPLPITWLWPLGVVQIACGEAHSGVVTVDGGVWMWGRGRAGALGLGSFSNEPRPTLVKALSGVKIKHISLGGDHTVAVPAGGEGVYAWGQGKWGATGLGHTDAVCVPQKMRFDGGAGGNGNGNGNGRSNSGSATVVLASAGGRHTLLLTDAHDVYATGCNEFGQCGSSGGGNTKIFTRPRKITNAPWVLSSLDDNQGVGVAVHVAAGGDHSLVATCSTSTNTSTIYSTTAHLISKERVDIPDPLIALVRTATLDVDTLEQKKEDDIHQRVVALPSVQALKSGIEWAFSNPSYLMHAFGINSNDNDHYSLFPSPHAIASISEFFHLALKLSMYDLDVVNTLGAASIRLLDLVERYLQHQTNSSSSSTTTSTPPTPTPPTKSPPPQLPTRSPLQQHLDQWLPPLLFISLQNHVTGHTSTYGAAIIHRISRLMSTILGPQLRVSVRRSLLPLLSSLARASPETFVVRCLRPVQKYLSHIVLSGRLGAGRLEAMMAGVLLDVLRQAIECEDSSWSSSSFSTIASSNSDGKSDRKIPYSEFYNKEVSDGLDLQAEYIAWVKHGQTNPNALVSFCQMPFLLTPEAKSNILHGESMLQKHQHMSAAAMQAFFRGESPNDAGFLRICVRRSHLVEDALNELATHVEDLKKPLRVTFVNEPAQDAGGVTKEFFQLLSREIFKPEFGMFVYDEAATRTIWFSPTSLESELEFGMVGALVGLAIYNSILLDVHFPLVVYKKLLGRGPLTFEDLKRTFPDLGRGLEALLHYDPPEEVESVFCRTFEVEYEYYGSMQKRELIANGANIPVTGDNRQLYVDAYTTWVLDTSIDRAFKAFANGFLRVCGGPALGMFTASELELLVCGLPHLDFEGLKRGVKYEGGYNEHTPVIQWFWDVVLSMSLEDKRAFLTFTTGSDRAPVGGLETLPFIVQRAGPDTYRLPTSHTCFNTLLLPEYASREKVRERLSLAVHNAQGFGLQ